MDRPKIIVHLIEISVSLLCFRKHTSIRKHFHRLLKELIVFAFCGLIFNTGLFENRFYIFNRIFIMPYIGCCKYERNALFFLKTYIEKVLVDSGIYPVFEQFFRLQTKESYETVKRTFSTFIINNTNINGVVECNRIFIKVLNPLAYFKNSRGTERGRLSEQNITYDMLMYNRNNFRDADAEKPKGVTRKEYAVAHPVEVNEAYYRYQSAKAKRFLRLFNDQNRGGQTEHLEAAHMSDKAIHMHHIFPEAIYPEICYYLENIIALTPTQHLNYAHPDGRTQEIDEQYQHLLLLSKADRIYENLTDVAVEKIYEFSNFLFVLNVGFDNDDILEIADMDFCAVINAWQCTIMQRKGEHYGKIRL